MVTQALQANVEPALTAMGFARDGKRAWTEGDLQVRAVIDSKADDPYSGGAFTLEFEVSTDGRFEEKLAGRVRIEQLLDADQRAEFLSLRNLIADRLGAPPPEHLAELHSSLHDEYLKKFSQADELERRFWMRFRTPEDLSDWCALIVKELPTLVERARTLPPNELVLGKRLEW